MDDVAIAGWAIDFIRAVRIRPWWARWLLRIALGHSAYREFVGLQDEVNGVGK